MTEQQQTEYNRLFDVAYRLWNRGKYSEAIAAQQVAFEYYVAARFVSKVAK
jgi:hypothetical protein